MRSRSTKFFDDVLERLQPTHILTQVQCEVCAVSLRDVEKSIASKLASAPKIVALNPCSLADIWDDFRHVGEAVGISAEPLIAQLQSRMQAIQRDKPPTIACIEWIEPLMPRATGRRTHPFAGGIDVFAAGRTLAVDHWENLQAKDPDIIIVAPCGFDLARTRTETHWLTDRPASIPEGGSQRPRLSGRRQSVLQPARSARGRNLPHHRANHHIYSKHTGEAYELLSR